MQLGPLLRRYKLHDNPHAVSGYRLLRRAASRVGLQIVLDTFYSPIPRLDELPPGVFERRSALAGVRFDVDEQLAWTRRELSGPMAEFSATVASAGLGPVYTSDNPTYTLLDATVLYGMLRRLRPRRVVELGSGASTLVATQALAANARDGAPGEMEVFDPYPGVVHERLPGLSHLERLRAQDVPLDTFDRLQSGDVLFVDTTHTVKVGSDVNFVILDVLPRLAPGVVVHFHDIFLPYEYPRPWVEDLALYWAEEYLLQAFLALNPEFDVLCAVAALCADRPAGFADALPPGMQPAQGSAFWMQRVERPR